MRIFTIHRGKATRPLLASIPHSALLIPPDIRLKFLIDELALEVELLRLTDRYVDQLFSFIPEMGGIAIRYSYSRLVADPERFEDDSAEPMAKKGMGAIYTKTSEGRDLRPIPNATEREGTLESYYRPYHRAAEREAEKLLASFGECLILDCHSFSSTPLAFEPDQDPDRPDLCIGTDDFHSPRELVQSVENFCRDSGLKVQRNHPYSGTYSPLKYWKKDSRINSLMIEVRRGLYMNETTGYKLRSFTKIKELLRKLVSGLVDVWERRK